MINMDSSLFDELFSECRELSSPQAWSRSVGLARRGTFSLVTRSSDGLEFLLEETGGVASRKVRLDPSIQIWECDCVSEEDPCMHVVATLIAVRNGQIETSHSFKRIGYNFVLADNDLLLVSRFASTSLQEEKQNPQQDPIRDLRPLLATKGEYSLDQEDTSLDQVINFQTPLRKDDLLIAFDLFNSSKRVYFEGSKVDLRLVSLCDSLIISEHKDGYWLRAIPVSLSPTSLQLNSYLWKNGNELIVVDDASVPKNLRGGGTVIPFHKTDLLFSTMMPKLQQHYAIKLDGFAAPEMVKTPPVLHFDVVPLGLDSIEVQARVVYGTPPFAKVEGDTIFPLSRNKFPIRDKESELQLQSELPPRLRESQKATFSGSQAVQFLESRSNNLSLSADLQHLIPSTEIIPAFESNGGEIKLFFRTDSQNPESLTSAAIVSSFRKGDSVIKLESGQWARIPRNWLEEIDTENPHLLSLLARERTPVAAVPALGKILRGDNITIPEHWGSFLNSLQSDKKQHHELPPLQATLRPYQSTGAQWLLNLKNMNIGCLLADDMGLGKTLQTICTMEPGTLVVCPTSVISSWKEQTNRFRPDLSINIYHGESRSMANQSDVTITSYGLLRRDINILSEIEWKIAILDEAHIIKNPHAQVSQSSRQIKATWKLALTGTPIENSTADLWSQFEFINPGLLPDFDSFGEWSQQKIASFTSPFILRRTKEQVAKDLPPKTEVVLQSELNSTERQLYSSILTAARGEFADDSSSGNTMQILEVLLRLRQTCSHPGLVSDELACAESSKIDLLIHSLRSSMENGHPALVFSQWVQLLDKIEPRLKKEGITFVRLDGATKNRAEKIAQFQKDDGPMVMLISLKAGGVGLTLTRAEHVYLTDPWWNPAVEEQAADRAHRIGQTNPVFVYKLIAKDTIEEHVLNLQRDKQNMIRNILGSQGDIKVTAKEMRELLFSS